MSILNKATGAIEETDDAHDFDWWSKEENRPLLESVEIAFERYSKIQYGGTPWTYASWRRHIVNAPSVRENFGLRSLPSARLWPRLRRVLEGDKGVVG